MTNRAPITDDDHALTSHRSAVRRPQLTGNERRIDGKVTRLMRDKGFGFIAGDDYKQYFFHRSSVDAWEDLDEGMLVDFVVVAAPKGPRAEAVRLREPR
jgi:cold shock CspA family protein